MASGCGKILEQLNLAGTAGLKGDPGDLLVPTASLNSVSLDVFNQTVSLNVSFSSPNAVAKYQVYMSQDPIDFSSATVWTTSSTVTPSITTDISVRSWKADTPFYVRIAAVDFKGNRGGFSNPLKIVAPNSYTATEVFASSNVSFYWMTQDANGLIYAGDRSNPRILRFDPANPDQSLTVFGTDAEFGTYLSLSVDSKGLIYVADWDKQQVARFDPLDFSGSFTVFGGDDAPNNPFSELNGLAIDKNGLVYVSDYDLGKIFRFDPNDFDNTLTEWGLPNSGLEGFAIDATGNIYVANWDDSNVMRFNPDDFTGTLTTIGTSDHFSTPSGVAISSDGIVYVANNDSDTITAYNPVDGSFEDLGSSGSDLGQFSSPTNLFMSGSDLYVVDGGNDRIQKLTFNKGLIVQGVSL